MKKRTVFISYSHDSSAHGEWVLALSERLRADGIETAAENHRRSSETRRDWRRTQELEDAESAARDWPRPVSLPVEGHRS